MAIAENISTAKQLQDRARKMLEKARGLGNELEMEKDPAKEARMKEQVRYFAEEARELTKIARNLVKKK